jgi:uncharacterized protein YxeA
MEYIIIGIVILILVGFSLFVYEAGHAEWVDSTEPFLHDDYDPDKDPTLKS